MKSSLLTYPLPHAVRAFSTTRHGGCSTGAYASMNCTSYTGDDPACVERNRSLLRSQLPGCEALLMPVQTHSTHSLAIGSDFLQLTDTARHERLHDVDALLTDRPGLCIAVSTADCIPVLLYDAAHQAVAAIHCGWRGIVQGILPQTLARMQALYGTTGAHLHAVLGPGISLSAFEVGAEVYDAFLRAGFPMPSISEWHPDTQRWHLDLPAACHHQLTQFGVPTPQIHHSDLCTFSHPDTFFSARRHGIRSGRILSGIYLVAESS